MARAIPKVGDIGTKVRVTVRDEEGDPLDLTGVNEKQIVMARADGTLVTYEDADIEVETDGTDGVMYALTADGDLTVPGRYFVEAWVQTSEGSWTSSRDDFAVHDVL